MNSLTSRSETSEEKPVFKGKLSLLSMLKLCEITLIMGISKKMMAFGMRKIKMKTRQSESKSRL